MASSGKQRTTWAKLNRESKLRDKRADKEARKAARKLSAANDGPMLEPHDTEHGTPPIDAEAATSQTSED